MQQHNEILFRDDLASNFKYDAIRVRLLELSDFQKFISLAIAMGVSVDFSRAFNASSDTPPSTSSAPIAKTLLLSLKEKLNLIKLRIVYVGSEVWRNIHGLDAQRDEVHV